MSNSLSTTGVDINFIAAQLQKIEEELIAVVPEPYFVDHILPMLAGDEGHTSVEPWIQLAGSTFNKMRVVNGAGDELFVLPPMSVSPRPDKDRESINSLYEVMEYFNMLSRVSSVRAAAYLTEKLNGTVKRAPVNYDNLKLIDEVLVRYGRKPRLPKEFYDALDGKSTANQSAGSNDDEIGDDL